MRVKQSMTDRRVRRLRAFGCLPWVICNARADRPEGPHNRHHTHEYSRQSTIIKHSPPNDHRRTAGTCASPFPSSSAPRMAPCPGKEIRIEIERMRCKRDIVLSRENDVTTRQGNARQGKARGGRTPRPPPNTTRHNTPHTNTATGSAPATGAAAAGQAARAAHPPSSNLTW